MHDKIKTIAAQTFNMQPDEIRLEFTPDDVPDWDSLNHLRLITAVEKEFSIRLTMNQIRTIQSIGDIAEVVGDPGV
jgi:acyl carrier protein